MKRQTFNVLFFIRKTRTVKSGETPIMLRITIQGQLAEMQLKRTVNFGRKLRNGVQVKMLNL